MMRGEAATKLTLRFGSEQDLYRFLEAKKAADKRGEYATFDQHFRLSLDCICALRSANVEDQP